ncbi:MAG: putative sensor protein [Pedosphaera sp.]|nr:putative sensor protein [Pedosphaera sp.]
MKNDLRILHLEDDRFDAELMRQILTANGLVRELVRVDSAGGFAAELDREPFDLILSDYTLPSFNGMEALAMARQKQPDTPFIFVSGTIDEELAVESLKQGAADYVFKNRLSRLVPAVRRASQSVEEREENRRAEEAMRQSEHKYRQVFETMSDAAFLTDLSTGRVLDANKEAELLLGRARSEIIGLNLTRFHAPAGFETCREALAGVLSGNTAADIESEIIRKDGTHVPVEIRANTLVLYGRRLILGLYRDVAARKQAEERIREQNKLLDLVPDAILVRDLEGRIQYWSEGAAHLYGWSRDEALGRNTRELLYHDTSEFEAASRTILKDGEWQGELHQVDRENHEILVHSRWTLMRNEQGEPQSILLVNSHVTESAPNRLHRQGRHARTMHGLR